MPLVVMIDDVILLANSSSHKHWFGIDARRMEELMLMVVRLSRKPTFGLRYNFSDKFV